MKTTRILQSVLEHLDGLHEFLTLEQRRRFIEYWQPIANARDIAAFEQAIERFQFGFCSRIRGLAAILPELNAPVADLGHPSIIAPGPVSEELLSFENKLILAEEVLRRFQQTVAETETATRQEDLPQAHADSAA